MTGIGFISILGYSWIGLILCFQYTHPRHDPNTKQLHKQVMDVGITTLLTVSIPIPRQRIGHDNCILHENIPLDLFSVLGLTLKHISSKKNYLLITKPHEQSLNSTHGQLIPLTRSSPCFKQYLKNDMDINEIYDEREIYKVRNVDVSIVLQSSLAPPLVKSVRGKINILVLSDVYKSYIDNIRSISSILKHLSEYDAVIVPKGSDAVNYPAIIRHAFLSYTNNNLASSGGPKFSYLLPNLFTVNLLLPSNVRKVSSLGINKSHRDVAVYIGPIPKISQQHIILQQVFQSFVSLRKSLFPWNNVTDTTTECYGKISGKLYIIADRSEYNLDISSLIDKLGIYSCQYALIYASDHDQVLEVLQYSSVLWIVYDPFQQIGLYPTCIFPPTDIHGNILNSYELCYYDELIQAIENMRSLVQRSIAVSCIPMALVVSADTNLKKIWSDSILVKHYYNGFIVTNYLGLWLAAKQIIQSAKRSKNTRFETAGKRTIHDRLDDDIAPKHVANIILNAYLDKSFRSFVQSSIDVVRGYKLSPAAIIRPKVVYNNNDMGNTLESKGLVSIIIDPRINFAIEYCVRNALHHLGSKWGIQVYYSAGVTGNEEYLRYVLSDLPQIEYVPLPANFVSGDDYNAFLKSQTLWRDLSSIARRVLIFQSDSLMIHGKIDPFLQYDFIGAPWHMTDDTVSYAWLKKLQRSGHVKRGIGNGGFSLRNPAIMHNISLTNLKAGGTMNEDVFFSMHTEKLSETNVSVFPNRSEAYAFALETPCDDLGPLDFVSSDARIPMAIHTAWAYLDIKMVSVLFNYSLQN